MANENDPRTPDDAPGDTPPEDQPAPPADEPRPPAPPRPSEDRPVG